MLIVDDQDLVREGLRMLVEAEPDLICSGLFMLGGALVAILVCGLHGFLD